eukprot:11582234-Alexandrium_andersonii.AAC.1
MSASLVGSEMCIRDSIRAHLHRSLVGACFPWPRPHFARSGSHCGARAISSCAWPFGVALGVRVPQFGVFTLPCPALASAGEAGICCVHLCWFASLCRPRAWPLRH